LVSESRKPTSFLLSGAAGIEPWPFSFV
jgi:hypothetical protein